MIAEHTDDAKQEHVLALIIGKDGRVFGYVPVIIYYKYTRRRLLCCNFKRNNRSNPAKMIKGATATADLNRLSAKSGFPNSQSEEGI